MGLRGRASGRSEGLEVVRRLTLVHKIDPLSRQRHRRRSQKRSSAGHSLPETSPSPVFRPHDESGCAGVVLDVAKSDQVVAFVANDMTPEAPLVHVTQADG